MLIRTIKESDVEIVAKFEREIALLSFGEDAITDIVHHTNKLCKAISKSTNGMLILEYKDKPVGWLWMVLQTNSVSLERYINFKSFYIEKGLDMKDASSILLQAGMNYAMDSGAKRIIGKTFVSNLPMRLLYKKFGFKPAHITMEYKLGDTE